MDYNFNKIEKKWSKKWDEQKTHLSKENINKKKYYVLDMFPYPSGSGLHVGHPLGYIASDIYARYKKLNGYNVLHPMGYDSFGLPAEQYAIETGQHPELTTKQNIKRYRNQLNKIGFSFDWSREIQTSDPKYYKWTQWIFKQLYQSYYCNIDDKALPISELIAEFERNGNIDVKSPCDTDTPIFTKKQWLSWTHAKQQSIVLKYRLAFLSETLVNWCEGLGTVLANDEVKDGFSERGNFPVKQKKMQQWSLRITAYAERLLNDLDEIDWSDAIKETQKNWIGKSKGVVIQFQTSCKNHLIDVFTTRPDTIFGTTFIVISPEHPLVAKIVTESTKKTVQDYCEKASLRSERDRQSDSRTISGVFSGNYVIHPFNKEKLPIWIADYVLSSYGTGAIMAVPCGDQRDWEFAQKFKLKIKNIFKNRDIAKSAYQNMDAIIANSDFLNDLRASDAIDKSTCKLVEMGIGLAKINYRLRDAIFSRQRYWGEPFPVYYKNGAPYIINNHEAVELPKIDKYLPTSHGEPPLARAKKSDWNIFEGEKMEYNTMPGWAGSSWYFLRFMDPKNEKEFVSKEKANYWGQVDLYIGGAEHAVGHLLYSRFWTKFLYDRGFINFKEPFKKLINQGMILGRSNFVYRITKTNTFVTDELKNKYKTNKLYVNIDFVKNDILDIDKFKTWRSEYKNAKFILNEDSKYKCGYEVEKMSKSKYNTQTPDDLVEKFGADTLRLYEMFLGPLEQYKPWDTNGINGVHNFLKKVWRLTHDKHNQFNIVDTNPTLEENKSIHKCIKKITQDLNRYSFNTVVSALMICINELMDLKCNKKAIISDFLILLSPYAPFITEELWEKLGNPNSISEAKWPKYNDKYLQESHFTYPVSFNGKLKFKLNVLKNLSKKEIENKIVSNDNTHKYLGGKKIKRIIIVPNKIINIVA
ncbi:MAG: leucine--tRNA ligase [Flavobacteriales bacterium]|nr:leucine--tRNA ligase [Flavobacteriales bacterium]|tara:strand:- start:11159 stop:13930 length:2772 start_codon:yes stop_codon:yes gene_type:complete